MDYKIGDKVKFKVKAETTKYNPTGVGEMVGLLEEQNAYLILAATILGTRQEVVVSANDVLGRADFEWK